MILYTLIYEQACECWVFEVFKLKVVQNLSYRLYLWQPYGRVFPVRIGPIMRVFSRCLKFPSQWLGRDEGLYECLDFSIS